MKYIKSISGYSVLSLFIPVLLCLLVGVIGSRVQSEAIEEWYPTLRKSYLTPPSYIFPIAWTILYICMGFSIGLIGYHRKWRIHWLMTLFSFQLFLNFVWSFLFFYLQSPIWGLIDILLLDLSVCIYIMFAFSRYRTSALLFVPYAAWLFLATYLNFYIWYYN
ncbi:MAG: TspO/MBR family protein [Phocaeicola sp.]